MSCPAMMWSPGSKKCITVVIAAIPVQVARQSVPPSSEAMFSSMPPAWDSRCGCNRSPDSCGDRPNETWRKDKSEWWHCCKRHPCPRPRGRIAFETAWMFCSLPKVCFHLTANQTRPKRLEKVQGFHRISCRLIANGDFTTASSDKSVRNPPRRYNNRPTRLFQPARNCVSSASIGI